MLRYVCTNPKCLNTFLFPRRELFKRCSLCDHILTRIGIPEKEGNNEEYPPSSETREELKSNYAALRKKALTIGLTESECLTVGRAIRKLSFEERKKLL